MTWYHLFSLRLEASSQAITGPEKGVLPYGTNAEHYNPPEKVSFSNLVVMNHCRRDVYIMTSFATSWAINRQLHVLFVRGEKYIPS